MLPPMKFSRFTTAAIVLLATVSLSGCAGETNVAEKVEGAASSSTSANAEAVSSKVFKVGDEVKLGDWQIQVMEVTDPFVSKDEFEKAPEGKRHVALDAKVSNNSSEPQTVSSMMCFDVRDAESRKFDTAFITSAGTELDGEIAAGKALRGNLVFEVDETSKDLVLNFKCDFLSSGTAEIALS